MRSLDQRRRRLTHQVVVAEGQHQVEPAGVDRLPMETVRATPKTDATQLAFSLERLKRVEGTTMRKDGIHLGLVARVVH